MPPSAETARATSPSRHCEGNCPHAGVPWFWPMHLFEMWMDEGAHVSSEILSFAAEAYKIDQGLKPVWSTPNTVTLELTTMHLRDFSASHAEGLPVIIDAPHAGHSATIADFSPRQSLVRTLKKHGLERLYVTDWKSASAEMKFLSIDSYLEEMNVVIDDLGGQAHLIGLCQGGWMSAAYAARFPGKVRTLTLAGSPIDTAVGDGRVKELAQTLPLHFYEDLVTAGGGRLLGKFMLAGWKSMHPTDQYLNKYVDLYTHIEDKAYVQRAEEFARWYESPVDLPGTYYLQAVQWIFKENRLALGNFVALGRALSLKDITIPVYLLAGEEDDITPPPQMLNADRYLGTPAQALQKKLVPGGHIGLFMAHKTLETAWPEIAQWIRAQERAEQP